MFPTGVGMNRGEDDATPDGLDVPHRRGDEPVLLCLEQKNI